MAKAVLIVKGVASNAGPNGNPQILYDAVPKSRTAILTNETMEFDPENDDPATVKAALRQDAATKIHAADNAIIITANQVSFFP